MSVLQIQIFFLNNEPLQASDNCTFAYTVAFGTLIISDTRQKEAMLFTQTVNLGTAISGTAVLDPVLLFVYPFTHACFGVLFEDP